MLPLKKAKPPAAAAAGNHDPATMKTTCSIILVEDHEIYRESIREALEDSGRYVCKGSFSSLEETFAATEQNPGTEVDLVLLDLGLPGMGGIEGIGRLRRCWPDARILVLTAFTNREKVFAALQAGASGYLVKTSSASRILQMLDDLQNGGTPLDPQIAGMILETFRKPAPSADESNRLSDQEAKVLQMLANGRTRPEVAAALEVSYSTVDQYLRRIFTKLHVHSLTAAVRIAMQKGLIDFF